MADRVAVRVMSFFLCADESDPDDQYLLIFCNKILLQNSPE